VNKTELVDRIAEAADISKASAGRALDAALDAITDSLKNHRKRIVELLHKHPGKWPTIRSEFKPVLNLLKKARQAS